MAQTAVAEQMFARPTIEARQIQIDEIAPWSDTGARNAVAHSMAVFGGDLVDPIVRELGGGKPGGGWYRYQVLDGARRLDELVKLGQKYVNVKVVPPGTDPAAAAAITVVTNLARTSNPVKEAQAFQQMLDEGYDRGAIGTLLGIPAKLVEKRLKLLRIPRQLFEGVIEGKIAPGTAERIANLRQEMQQRCVALFAKQGRLIGADIAEVQRVRRQELADESPELFEDLEVLDTSMVGFTRDWIEAYLHNAREEGEISKADMLALVERVYEGE